VVGYNVSGYKEGWRQAAALRVPFVKKGNSDLFRELGLPFAL
jgi:hypothetical protein